MGGVGWTMVMMMSEVIVGLEYEAERDTTMTCGYLDRLVGRMGTHLRSLT